MLICLDYDKTITADPEMWEDFILSNPKHDFIICTNRSEDEPIPDEWAGAVNDVYYSDGAAKSIYLDGLGINPDIWIDDDPVWIFYDKSLMYEG